MPDQQALTEADVAYVAAVIDTQAKITYRKVRDSLLPQVQVCGSNTALLRWLGDLTGVRPIVTERDYTKHNCTIHCPTRHARIVSVSGRWTISGAKATVLLHTVLPYLRFQVQTAQEAVAVGMAVHYKGATVRKMQALGWTPPPS